MACFSPFGGQQVTRVTPWDPSLAAFTSDRFQPMLKPKPRFGMVEPPVPGSPESVAKRLTLLLESLDLLPLAEMTADQEGSVREHARHVVDDIAHGDIPHAIKELEEAMVTYKEREKVTDGEFDDVVKDEAGVLVTLSQLYKAEGDPEQAQTAADAADLLGSIHIGVRKFMVPRKPGEPLINPADTPEPAAIPGNAKSGEAIRLMRQMLDTYQKREQHIEREFEAVVRGEIAIILLLAELYTRVGDTEKAKKMSSAAYDRASKRLGFRTPLIELRDPKPTP
jgi:hypothetical protein